MAEKKIKVVLDVDSDIEPTIKNLKALKQQQKEVVAGSADWKKYADAIRDMEDSIKDAKETSDDFAGYLENASGPLGMFGGAIRGAEKTFSSFNAALKASVIGLLVGIIGGLVSAFTKTEGSLKKLEPLTIGLEKIMGGIVEVAMPLVETFLDLGLKALPAVTTGVKYVYAAISGLFTYIKTAGEGVFKFWKGVLTFDLETIKDGLVTLGSSFGKTADSFVAATERFDKGAAKTTATQKKNAEEAAKAASEAEAKRKEALDKAIAAMEANDKLDAAQLEKAKAQAMALANTEQEKLNVEESFGKRSYELRKKDLEDKAKLLTNPKDVNALKAAQAELLALETEFINTTTANRDKQKTINEETRKKALASELKDLELSKSQGLVTEEAYQKQLLDIKLKYGATDEEKKDAQIAYNTWKLANDEKLAADSRAIAVSDMQAMIDDLDAKNALLDSDFQADLERLDRKKFLLEQQREEELKNTKLTEKEKNDIVKKYSDELKKVEKEKTDTVRAEEEAKHAIRLQMVAAAGAIGQLMRNLAGENKDVAIAGLLIENGAALASIAINASKNFVKDGGVTSPLAWANLTMAGVQAANVVAATAKGIRDIRSSGSNGSASGGSSSMPTTSMPSVSAGPQLMAPQIASSTANPSSALASMIGESVGNNINQQPVRAYIVQSDIRNSTSFDRRISAASKL